MGHLRGMLCGREASLQRSAECLQESLDSAPAAVQRLMLPKS